MTPEDQQHVVIDTTPAEKPQSPKIFADIASSFTYASYQNAIPVLRGIGVDNQSDRQVQAAVRKTRRGRETIRTLWSRVPPALQLMSVFRAATGRQMRRSPDGGIIIKSVVAVFG